MTWNYETVRTSYDRCLQSEVFFDSFYETFLSKSPEIPPMFVKTDFARQKQMLSQSISHMLAFASGNKFTQKILDDTAKTHSRDQRNIEPRFYSIWLDSLCETIKKHDPDWSPELEHQWRQALKPGIDLMIAAY